MNLSIFDLRQPLQALRDGRKLHDSVGLVLQLLIVLAGVLLIGVWRQSWFPGSESGIGFFGWIALLLWQVAWPVAVFFAIQALFLRAGEIRRLPSSRYTVAPMVECMLRGVGEALMALLLVMAVPAMLAFWFNGEALVMHLLPSLPNPGLLLFCLRTPRFWAGILALVLLPAQGLVVLLGSYFAAESFVALFAIAEDVHELRIRSPEPTPEDHA